jgi:hypothetical protein
VADLLTHYAETAEHYFEIWCINPPFAPSPSFEPEEFTVVDWAIRYEGLDKFQPGIVPSQLDLQVLDGPSPFIALLTINYDSSSFYYCKIYTKGKNCLGSKIKALGEPDYTNKYNAFAARVSADGGTMEPGMGPSLNWAGVFIGDLGAREVVNGVRVTTLAAADGFGALDQVSNGYVWNNTILPFTDQIAGQLGSAGLWNLFSGFYISENITHKSAPTDRNILHYSGTTQYHYLYNQNTFEWRTTREWLDSLLVAFGMQLYQKDGYLWFRALWIENPAYWDLYNRNGSYQSRTTTQPTLTLDKVIADGLLTFKPAAKYYSVTDLNSVIVDGYEAGGSGDLFKAAGSYIFAATYLSDGSNHLDYDIVKRLVFGLPSGYTGNIDFELRYYVEFQTPFGSYYWNGSNAWLTSITYKSWNYNNYHISNLSGVPVQAAYDFPDNNVHLPATPIPLGLGLIYHKFDFIQTGGSTLPTNPFGGPQPLEALKWSYTYDGTTGAAGLTYEIDNSKSLQGFNQNVQTYHGDSYASLLLAPGIRIFTNTGRTTYVQSLGKWSSEELPLNYLMAYYLMQKQTRPLEYYEVSLNDPTQYFHRFYWGSKYYRPINLTYTHDGANITLLEMHTGTPQSAGRQSQSI